MEANVCVHPRSKTFYGRFGKRALDLTIAIPALLISFVPMLITGAAILISSGRPIFFRQDRVGRFGRRFRITKFRTMTVDSATKATVTIAGDPRITNLGRILRQSKLDEFPELWNVIRGDMSLVGPRPDVPGFADSLTGTERLILELSPGITGPATLTYCDEEVVLGSQVHPEKYNREVMFPHKVKINLSYLDELSLRKDVYYLLQTVGVLLQNYRRKIWRQDSSLCMRVDH
jgi:lipopolysaccharide/colanic/teichoic acid biosynthesis glycosyltransferase